MYKPFTACSHMVYDYAGITTPFFEVVLELSVRGCRYPRRWKRRLVRDIALGHENYHVNLKHIQHPDLHDFDERTLLSP